MSIEVKKVATLNADETASQGWSTVNLPPSPGKKKIPAHKPISNVLGLGWIASWFNRCWSIFLRRYSFFTLPRFCLLMTFLSALTLFACFYTDFVAFPSSDQLLPTTSRLLGDLRLNNLFDGSTTSFFAINSNNNSISELIGVEQEESDADAAHEDEEGPDEIAASTAAAAAAAAAADASTPEADDAPADDATDSLSAPSIKTTIDLPQEDDSSTMIVPVDDTTAVEGKDDTSEAASSSANSLTSSASTSAATLVPSDASTASVVVDDATVDERTDTDASEPADTTPSNSSQDSSASSTDASSTSTVNDIKTSTATSSDSADESNNNNNVNVNNTAKAYNAPKEEDVLLRKENYDKVVSVKIDPTITVADSSDANGKKDASKKNNSSSKKDSKKSSSGKGGKNSGTNDISDASSLKLNTTALNSTVTANAVPIATTAIDVATIGV